MKIASHLFNDFHKKRRKVKRGERRKWLVSEKWKVKSEKIIKTVVNSK